MFRSNDYEVDFPGLQEGFPSFRIWASLAMKI